jgi:hypothetical protein
MRISACQARGSASLLEQPLAAAARGDSCLPFDKDLANDLLADAELPGNHRGFDTGFERCPNGIDW